MEVSVFTLWTQQVLEDAGGHRIEEHNSSVRSVFIKHELPRGILAKRPKIWPLHAESSSKGCGGDSCHTGGSLGHILSVSGSPMSHVASGKLRTHETQCRPGGKSSRAESEVKAGLCATISVP